MAIGKLAGVVALSFVTKMKPAKGWRMTHAPRCETQTQGFAHAILKL